MQMRVAAAVVLALSLSAFPALAQETSQPSDAPAASAGAASTSQPGQTWLTPDRIDLAPATRTRSPFLSIDKDIRTFFSGDTARFLGFASVMAVAAAPWDKETAGESREWGHPGAFRAGNIGGNFVFQTSAGVVTYAIGKMSHNTKATLVGGDLFRAQMLSQVMVQGMKAATRRPRPDGSDHFSFPSGHTASAFATATVLQRYFGSKVGIPAYGFAAYVGAARMSANKHHLSDVMMGAAVGIAAGHSVTVGVGRTKFDLGVMPTQGGAAVTFTQKK
jgi:membrane-associated phospholipid phosphatase